MAEKKDKKQSSWADRHNIKDIISIKGLSNWNHLILAEEKLTGKKVMRLRKFRNWWVFADYRHVEKIIAALNQGSKKIGWVNDDSIKDIPTEITLSSISEVLKSRVNGIDELKTKKKSLKKDIEDLEKIKQQSNILFYQEKISELEERISIGNQSETSGKNSWQKWIYENNWLMGANYLEPIEKSKVGFSSIPDFIFPSIDGFLDLLEIKRLEHEPIESDPSHPGAFMWTRKASEAIGQVVNYIHQIELHQMEIKQNIQRAYPNLGLEIFTIKPRAFILMGNSTLWSPEHKEAFRKLNYSLHGIEVLTYSDLLIRGKNIISMYSKK
jgi:hypothetical protein